MSFPSSLFLPLELALGLLGLGFGKATLGPFLLVPEREESVSVAGTCNVDDVLASGRVPSSAARCCAAAGVPGTGVSDDVADDEGESNSPLDLVDFRFLMS